ncbi:MAG: hypothetical protein LBO21_00575, partial [Synergistaceae bacterium]|nr:hypothetical protein [Synergistaceae bacterium]
FAWSNQTIAVFAFAIITIYLIAKGHTIAPFMSLIPGAWYCFITFSYICNAKIGLNLPMNVAYILGVVLAAVYSFLVYRKGLSLREKKTQLEAVPVF